MPKGILTKPYDTGRRVLPIGAEVNVTWDKFREMESAGYFSEAKPLKAETHKLFAALKKKDEEAPAEAIDSEGDE